MRTERWTEDKLIQKDICFECGSDNEIEYHHVVPYIKGGTKTIPLCIECHSKVHSIDFVKARELKKIGIQKARERGVVFGRTVGWKESDEQFLEKEKPKKVIEYLKQGYSYTMVMESVGCSKSLVYKVKKLLESKGEVFPEIKVIKAISIEKRKQKRLEKYKDIFELLKENGYLKNKDIAKILNRSTELVAKCRKQLIESFNNNTIQTNNTFF